MLIEANRIEATHRKQADVQASGYGRSRNQLADSLRAGINMALTSDSEQVREHAEKWGKFLQEKHDNWESITENTHLVSTITEALNSYVPLDNNMGHFADTVNSALADGSKTDEQLSTEFDKTRNSAKPELNEQGGWEHKLNPMTGQTVYYNNATGESTLDEADYHQAIQNESNKAFAQAEIAGVESASFVSELSEK